MSAVERMSMLEIGTNQLKHAILHLNAREFVSAITLAGAADEILGRLAKGALGKDAHDEFHRWYADVARIFYGSFAKEHGYIPAVKDIRNNLNAPRNALKHNDAATNHDVEFDFEEAALGLIDSALKNLIMFEGYKAPTNPTVADYHLNSPRWNGVIPKK